MSEREEAKKLFDEGLSPTEISKRLNIPANKIRAWKSRYKWETVAQHEPQPEPQQKAQRNKNVHQPKVSTRRSGVVSVEVETPLTEGQELFCQIFVKQLNATMAYMKSHVGCTYNTAMTEGSKYLRKPKIRARIEQLKAEKLQTILVGKDDIVEKHMRIAFADITNYASWGFDGLENQFAAMPSELVDGDLVKMVSKSDKGFRIELHDPQKSLDWLSNYFGMNPMDQHKIDFDLRKQELDQKIAEARIEKMKVETEKIAEDDSNSNLTVVIEDDYGDEDRE